MLKHISTHVYGKAIIIISRISHVAKEKNQFVSRVHEEIIFLSLRQTIFCQPHAVKYLLIVVIELFSLMKKSLPSIHKIKGTIVHQGTDREITWDVKTSDNCELLSFLSSYLQSFHSAFAI